MHRIEYNIILNEDGRPCIDLSDEYIDKAEDKFFAIELSRYLLQGVYSKRSDVFDQDTTEKIEMCVNLLGQLSDEMASILWDGMKNLGDVNMMMMKQYHVKVSTKKDLDNLPEKNIMYADKIFDKIDGLIVLVEEDMEIFEFKNNEWLIKE